MEAPSDLLRTLLRRWWQVLFICLAAGLVAAGATRLLPKGYRAETRLIFPPAPRLPTDLSLEGLVGNVGATPSSVPLLGGLSSLPNYSLAPDVCMSILRSQSTLAELCERFGLRRVYHSRLRSQAMKQLERDTSIRFDRNGALILRVEAGSPALALDLARAYVERLERISQELSTRRARERHSFIARQREETLVRLTRAEEAARKLQESQATASWPERVKELLTVDSTLQSERTLAEARATEAQKQLQRMEQLGNQEAKESLRDLPGYAQLELPEAKELTRLRVELALMLETRQEDNPHVLNLRERIAENERHLSRAIEKKLKALQDRTAPEVLGLEREYVASLARGRALAGAEDRIAGELRALPAVHLKLLRLERQAELLTARFKLLSQEEQKAELAMARGGVEFEVLDPPVLPDRHFKPRLSVNVGLALLAALLASIFLIALRERPLGQAPRPDSR